MCEDQTKGDNNLEAMVDEASRKLAIQELRLLVEKYAGVEEPPRAMGGPYSLTPQEMLHEVENDTEVGRQIVAAFTSLRKQFPLTS